MILYLLDGLSNEFGETHSLHLTIHGTYLAIIFCCYFYSRYAERREHLKYQNFITLVFILSLAWASTLGVVDDNLLCYTVILFIFAAIFVPETKIFGSVQLVFVLYISVGLYYFGSRRPEDFLNVIDIMFVNFLAFFLVYINYPAKIRGFLSAKVIEEQKVQLAEFAQTDSLTTLLNRRKYGEVLDQEWRKAVRLKSSLAIIIFDIDYFKAYNDTYGHLQGDECLRAIGRQLKTNFKRATEYVFRYGGEEFVILLMGMERDQCEQICQRMMYLIKELKLPHEASKVSDIVTVSAGMSYICPVVGERPDDLVEMADNALYKAKEHGRNCYFIAE